MPQDSPQDRDAPATRAAPRVRRSLVVRHVVLSAALWITYVVYWRVVLVRGVEREAAFAMLLLGLFVLLQILFTHAWVLHNRGLARRHAGRRRRRPEGPARPERDFLGRRIRDYPEDGDLRLVPLVVVRVADGEKRFEAGLSLTGEAGREAP